MDDFDVCFGCGVKLPATHGEPHPYLGASASCWAAYGEVLAREYADPLYMKVHRLTVDSYAAQHPGKPERRSIQSVWLHLAGLYLTLEKGLSAPFVTQVLGSMARISATFRWLEPPTSYSSNVADVFGASDPLMHSAMVRRWAEDVWAGWQSHQA